MSPRPAIFISAVSGELRSARQLVANALTFLGYDPEWQDIFGTEEGDLRAMLQRRIHSCKGVVQLVGQCYGAEPASIDQQFGRVSYTQYEALYALRKGKKVWYLFLDDNFPADTHATEEPEKTRLQAQYRDRLRAETHLYHPLGNKEGLEASVIKLRDDLTHLRRGVKRWAAFVAVLLVLSVGLSVWLVESQQHSNVQQQHTNEQLQTLQAKFDKLEQGVSAFAAVQNQVRQAQPGQKPDELEERTYEELGKKLGLSPNALREQLPRFAQELKNAPNAATYERANAAYVDKDYNEAQRLALAAADEARDANPPKNAEAIRALELAAWAAEKHVEYADALKRLHDAERLTDRARDSIEWARVQFAIAWVLQDQGQYRESESILHEVINEREHSLGSENSETVAARFKLAYALALEGNYVEAEDEYRAVAKLREKLLGPENADTLAARNNLATVLRSEGKYAEAETEFRAVITLKEKNLGPDHPSTLTTRQNLANVLYDQGKYPDAEKQYRELIALEQKVLGSEHPNTFGLRSNLANMLDAQGKYDEAETEYRAVVNLAEKIIGPEHPDTLGIRSNLAETLDHEGKYAEAESEDRAVIQLKAKVIGSDNPDTLETRSNLAQVLDHLGKYGEAETEDLAVITLREKVLGPKHPDTLETRNNLAEVFGHEGRYEKAEVESRAVLELREKVLGSRHPETLLTCFDLAVCLWSERKTEEAARLAQRAADGALKVLGQEHPDTKKYEQFWQELQAARVTNSK
jgi:tetratricopeptide (TPR) repeat protein